MNKTKTILEKNINLQFSTLHSVCVRARRDATSSAERDLAAQLRSLVEHYKGDDPVGIPGAPIPDPVDVPDMKRSFTVTSMDFKKIKVYGLSKFRFQRIKLDLAALQTEVGVKISTLLMAGQYTLGGWFSRSNGPFTVTLNGVLVEGVASLEVDRNGNLEAQNIHLDIKFESIKLDFQNLGGAAYLFQVNYYYIYIYAHVCFLK
jgi:Haemolymph juvenile hormone binding protein (JHBP)